MNIHTLLDTGFRKSQEDLAPTAQQTTLDTQTPRPSHHIHPIATRKRQECRPTDSQRAHQCPQWPPTAGWLVEMSLNRMDQMASSLRHEH